MLPASALSDAAYGMRELLVNEIADITDVNRILIGPPTDNFETLKNRQNTCLNLFFYEIQHGGYPSDVTNNNPFYVRIRCLITALGAKTTGSPRDISSGENELRVIGEVMRVFHQNPLLALKDATDKDVALLQIVPYTMNLDNLNHVWSTQNDAAYRISVAYELGLAPVPAEQPVDTSPLVHVPRAIAIPSNADTPATDIMLDLTPQVEYLDVDDQLDSWVPHICHVKALGGANESLHYISNITGNLNTELDILVAGKDQGQVSFYWNVWCKKTDNSISGWQEALADTAVPLVKQITDPAPTPANPFYPNRIDPQEIDPRRVFKAALPEAIKGADVKSWQAVLYAVHEWENAKLVGSPQNPVTEIRSNTLLFYGANP